ncbi:MAG: hypothetical protein H7331_03860 [Bacteroidia bacterium]|nr:hypothetical protein [Bacteroidia bacterium]
MGIGAVAGDGYLGAGILANGGTISIDVKGYEFAQITATSVTGFNIGPGIAITSYAGARAIGNINWDNGNVGDQFSYKQLGSNPELETSITFGKPEVAFCDCPKENS